MTEKKFGLSVRAVLLDAQGRCLLMRRSMANKHMAGQWEWPGGKVDAGEDFMTALHRELAEETGLSVAVTGFAGTADFWMADKNLHVLALCMEAVQTGGTLTLSHENDAAEWVPLSEWSRYDLVTPMRDFMLNYAARRQAD